MFFLAILTLLLSVLAAAAPAPVVEYKGKNKTCLSGNFNDPWIVRDIFMWQPLSAAPTTNTTGTNGTNTPEDIRGSINFIFIDPNEGLEMMTLCECELINGATPDPNGGYNVCKNDDVWFQFDKEGKLSLERFYKDPCLGPPPYDGGQVSGHRKTGMVPRLIEGFGLVATKVRLLVKIKFMA